VEFHPEGSPNPFIFLGFENVESEQEMFCPYCCRENEAQRWGLDAGLVVCPECQMAFSAEEVMEC
jgi:uncharacterized Zn-finger protein